jgi:hypothetical protein
MTCIKPGGIVLKLKQLPPVRLSQLEHGHGAHQVLRLRPQAAGRRRHFFHQGGVLLRRLVHLRHGVTDL